MSFIIKKYRVRRTDVHRYKCTCRSCLSLCNNKSDEGSFCLWIIRYMFVIACQLNGRQVSEGLSTQELEQQYGLEQQYRLEHQYGFRTPVYVRTPVWVLENQYGNTIRLKNRKQMIRKYNFTIYGKRKHCMVFFLEK